MLAMKNHSILRNLLKKISPLLMILFVSLLSFSPLSFSSHQRPKLSCQEIVLPRYQVYQRPEDKKEEKIKALDEKTKQILRHQGFIPPGSKMVSFGELDVNLEFKVAKRNFVKLELTSLEFLILVLLIHSSNQYITVQEIRERLSVTYPLISVNTCLHSLSSLSQKIGARSPISTSSFPSSPNDARASVYLSFKKKGKKQKSVKINKIPSEFKITSIDTKNRSVLATEKKNHSQVTQKKQISLGGHFDFFLSLLDFFKYAGETLSSEQISQKYIRKTRFTDITEMSLNDLSEKIPGLLFVNMNLYTLNSYVLDERIMEEYQISKEPRDLKEISGLKISSSSPFPAIYYEGYRHNLSSTQLKLLLFLLKNPEKFFSIQHIRDQINNSSFLSDVSKSEEGVSVFTTWNLAKNLLDTLTPLGVDLRLKNKVEKTKKLIYSDEFGFFGLKRPNSFLILRKSLALNMNSRNLTMGGVRSVFKRQQRFDFLSHLITHLGSILTVSQFPPSFFYNTKAWPFLNLQKAENQFGFFNTIFGEAFIPIEIFVKNQWFMFGYKLVYSLEPEWENYSVFNINFSIQLDPVFQRIKINNREFSLPYLNFKILHIILNAFQRTPYLEEEKKLSEMELSFQVLFWFLIDEEKISSLHPSYPLEISEAFSVLRYLFPEQYKALRNEIEKDFPELENHLKQINSNQTNLRSSFNRFSQLVGLKKSIAILKLYREGEYFSEISRRLKITPPSVSKIKRDFTQFLKDWEKMAEYSELH